MNYTSKTDDGPKVMSTYELICQLDARLCGIVEGGDRFIIAIAAARLALRNLKKFL